MRQLAVREINAGTSSPWMRSARHTLPTPRALVRNAKRFRINPVKHDDRIKYWNIVPGDQIRIVGDKKNTIHEVLSINRFNSRVFVKGAGKDESDTNYNQAKYFHYSRCQLFIGDYELPPSKSNPKPHVVPVFAQRVGTSSPMFNRFFRRFAWDRFASKTVPNIPHLKGEKIAIPWPKPTPATVPEPSTYDTSKEEVLKVTYKPPAFHPGLKGPLPRPPPEKDFLRALYNKHVAPTFDDSAPVETYLSYELSNPHSSAKKHARWLAYQEEKRARLQTLTNEAFGDMKGISPREAKAEATFRWRQEMAEREAEIKANRHTARRQAAKLDWKVKRQERKELKKRQRLTELSLKEESNQVVPKDL